MILTKTNLENIVSEALEGKEIKGDFNPSVCISQTSFGKSCYIQNTFGKIRISDHSVSNFSRMNEETLLSSDTVTKEDLIVVIEKMFSNEYTSLYLVNGDETINFNLNIKKSEVADWSPVMISFTEIQYGQAIKLEKMNETKIVKEYELTKKKNKMICDIEVKKWSFGAYNNRTGKHIRTRFGVADRSIKQLDLV